MRSRSKSSWLIDTLVVAAGVAAIMATTGSVRALPIAPDAGCQVREGGSYVRVAVLRPELTTVWFERDSATLSDAGAQALQSAVSSYQPGAVIQLQLAGAERPNKPSDHVAIDRVITASAVMALSGVPQDAVAILPGEQQLGCSR